MKMIEDELKVFFYLKKKNIRNGLCPLMGRISVGRSMAAFSCRLNVSAALWDTRAQKVRGKSADAQSINRKTEQLLLLIRSRCRELAAKHTKASATDVKNAVLGVSTAQDTLLTLFREHNESVRIHIGSTYSLRTWEIFESAMKHLERFIRHRYRLSDIPLQQLDASFIEQYDYHLRIELKLMPNTVNKQIVSMKKIIKIAVDRGIISNPFANYSIVPPKPQHRYLPQEELQLLMEAEFTKPNLSFVRDMFVFSSYTGLAYIDLYNLSDNSIRKAEDGTFWIEANRQKTNTPSNIPLLEEPLGILMKYRGISENGKIFPMFRCDATNRYLKEIARQCGITRRLTFHMARHTFATETCLSQGVPIETVSRMMGHRKISTTQMYAHITDNKIKEDVQRLSERIREKYKLVSIE